VTPEEFRAATFKLYRLGYEPEDVAKALGLKSVRSLQRMAQPMDSPRRLPIFADVAAKLLSLLEEDEETRRARLAGGKQDRQKQAARHIAQELAGKKRDLAE